MKLEEELKKYKVTDDKKLMILVEEIESGLNSDDGTPGLGDYLWDTIILPKYKEAKERYIYVLQTNAAINIAAVLKEKRLNCNGRNIKRR